MGAPIVAVAMALCAHALAATPAAAQARVTSARLLAQLAGEESGALVRVEYALSGAAAGDSVAVTLLDFGAGVPRAVQVGEGARSVRLDVTHGAARGARLPLEPSGDGLARLVVTYRVPLPPGGVSGQVAHLPVLTVDGPPEAARAGLFQVEVNVPSGWRVTEAFPTGLRAAGVGGALRAQLPVVPSVVTLRFSADGSRGFPLLLVVNLLAAACLAAVGIAGWRQLSPAGREEARSGGHR